MAYGIGSVVCFLRTILIRITVGPISLLFLELTKFMLVLALAFWVTVGIFLMWESIMPEAAVRLSAAAGAVVANTSGLMPNDEGKGNADGSRNYPFIVDLPKTASSDLETQIKQETLLQTAAASANGPKMPAKESILVPITSTLEIAKVAKTASNIEERRRSSRPQQSKEGIAVEEPTTTKENEIDEVLKTEESDE